MEGRPGGEVAPAPSRKRSPGSRKNRVIRWTVLGGVIVGATTVGVGLANTASSVRSELTAAVQLLPQLEHNLAADQSAASRNVNDLKQHTAKAREDSSNPLWTLAALLPWVGPNFQAVSDVAVSADDVARLGAEPLVATFQSLDWRSLVPDKDGVDLERLQEANPKLQSAAHAVASSSERLNDIDASQLFPQVAEPLVEAQRRLATLSSTLDTAAKAASISPSMLGADGPRSYLLIVQNNAEPRATGGIPGALATLYVEKGQLSLGTQSSASAMGSFSPPLPVDLVQQQIYSNRLGKYMQDVNLTPNFPSAAATAKAMWEIHTSQHVDGVISIDPVALSYLLDAAGPVKAPPPGGSRLPDELNSENVVNTLLSGVYTEIPDPDAQDLYYAMVAKQIFDALGNGQADSHLLLDGLGKGADEGRVLLWSPRPEEQSVIETHRLGGAIAGANVQPSEFGVYFNDGTGAKMDYYVKRKVQLVKQCPKDGYEEITVRVTSTNTAPTDAAASLPAYVTGDGHYGVPPGSVQTNIVTYGPVQATIETAKLNGQMVEFAPYIDSSRPVGVVTVRLAPGESQTVELTFGKIVQHTEPNLVVTPTVQAVKDVTVPTETVACS